MPERAPLPTDRDADRVLAELAARGGPVVEPAVVAARSSVTLSRTDGSNLYVRRFDRTLDVAWRRVSYSSLAAAAEQATHDVGSALQLGVASEPETTERADELLTGRPGGGTRSAAELDERQLLDLPSPMSDLPAGTSFGTLVHAVLEHADPQAADLRSELLARSREQLARRPLAATADALATALEPVLLTPLGPIAQNLALREIPRTDRLAELDFELPLAGGDRPGEGAILSDLAPLLRRHLAADDPLAGYAHRLETPDVGWQSLRGYLTGSLDVVLRLPGPSYVVADYKTNWLGDAVGTPLSLWHYRPEALRSVMAASHYPLQALLYCVALHRYLRWRQPAYDPDRHLGGVLYLYVRGMAGAETPVISGNPCGVFGWRPPTALVRDLSRLLDEGAA